MKLTAWYPAHIKPARVGVYLTHSSSDGEWKFFQYWNGRKWGGSASNEWFAYVRRDEQTEFQRVQWRGLAEAPK